MTFFDEEDKAVKAKSDKLANLEKARAAKAAKKRGEPDDEPDDADDEAEEK